MRLLLTGGGEDTGVYARSDGRVHVLRPQGQGWMKDPGIYPLYELVKHDPDVPIDPTDEACWRKKEPEVKRPLWLLSTRRPDATW